MKDTIKAKRCCRVEPMEQSRPDDGGIKVRIVCLFCGKTSTWANNRKAAIKGWNNENRPAAQVRER